MLAQLHPGIRAKVAAVLTDLAGHRRSDTSEACWRPRIQQAHRTAEQQARYLAAGNSTVIAAVAGKDWNAVVGLGWDAGHVEVKGITLAQAKRGARPPIQHVV